MVTSTAVEHNHQDSKLPSCLIREKKMSENKPWKGTARRARARESEKENKHSLSRSIFSNLIHLKVEKINQRTNTPEKQEKENKNQRNAATDCGTTHSLHEQFFYYLRSNSVDHTENEFKALQNDTESLCWLSLLSLHLFFVFLFELLILCARSLLKNTLELNIVETIITVHSRLGNKRLTGDFFFSFSSNQ